MTGNPDLGEASQGITRLLLFNDGEFRVASGCQVVDEFFCSKLWITAYSVLGARIGFTALVVVELGRVINDSTSPPPAGGQVPMVRRFDGAGGIAR